MGVLVGPVGGEVFGWAFGQALADPLGPSITVVRHLGQEVAKPAVLAAEALILGFHLPRWSVVSAIWKSAMISSECLPGPEASSTLDALLVP